MIEPRLYRYVSYGKTVEVNGVSYIIVEKPDSSGNCWAVPKRRYNEYLRYDDDKDLKVVICLADATPKDEIEVRGADNQLLFTVPDFGRIVVNGEVFQLSYINNTDFEIVDGGCFTTFSTCFLTKIMKDGIDVRPYVGELA